MGNACQNPHRSDEVKLYDACRKKATKKDEVERILEEFEQKEKEKILKARHGMQLQEEVEIIENARCGGYNALVQNTEFIEATPDDRLDHCNATVKELAQKEVAKIVNAHHGMNSLTALHVATMNNNLDVVTLLLKKGALVENTSLIEATDSELQEEVEIIENARRRGYGALVETTEFIEATDSSGQTALHKASKRGYTDIVKVLLEYDADPLTQDMYGRTSLELAKEYSDDATQEWLKTMPIWLKLIENSPQDLKDKCEDVLSNEKAVILIKTSTKDYLKIRSNLDNLEPLLDAIAKVQKEKYEHCIEHIKYESDYMVYPDTPGIRHILEGLTKFPSIEGAFLKVKLNGKKDAVLKAMSQANALIGKEMCEPQDTILNMPSSNFDEKCKQIALQCGIRVDCSADERGALKLRGPKAQLLSALKSINEVLTSQIEKTLHLPDGTVIGKLPDTWEDMTPEQTVKKVPLDKDKNHDEYDEVQTLFLGRSGGIQAEIVSIERIQNPSLYLPYAVKKYTMEKQYRSEFECERKLFHGTREDATHMINAQGFNRVFAGKNATLYGTGVYFAMNAKYSARDTYSVPDGVGNKYIYLSLVLTGKYTCGNGDMKTPPPKPPPAPSAELYDSVVDNTVNPEMFIVFNDSQAYPQYLITFKKTHTQT